MDDRNLLTRPAVELARDMRAARLSPIELVDAHIRRCTAVNARINAVVADRFDEARREAEAAARELNEPPRADRPLLGVPFTVKEMIEVEGMPLTFGSEVRRARRGEGDATVVARLRAAGAILLGVTNVPEWGMWPETYNRVYGLTRNPWDVCRTAGGSSGGEGAIIGAGGAPFGIGADIGGSIRIPAACCGVFGHKPTTGLLPLTGHYPVYAEGPDAGLEKRSPYVAVGPLARSAHDLGLLLRIMAGPDDTDPNVEPLPLGDPETVDWAGRRVLVLDSPHIARASRTVASQRAAVQRVAATLAGHGAELRAAPVDLFRRAADIWFAALQSVGGRSFAESVTGGAPLRLPREVVATSLGRGAYSWTALLFCIGERVGRRSPADVRRALSVLAELEERVVDLLGDGGVLIMPTQPRPAPRHHAPVLRPFDFLYTAAINALRLPATTMPVGLDARGLPLAVQAVSLRSNDHITIAAARLAGEWPGLPPAFRD